METTVKVKHRQVLPNTKHIDFTAKPESLLRCLDPEYSRSVPRDPNSLRAHLEKLQGDTGLILFNIQHLGDLLNLVGKPRLAKQYVIGNPLIAIEMNRYEIGAALHPPLRMLIYERAEKIVATEYELPSSTASLIMRCNEANIQTPIVRYD